MTGWLLALVAAAVGASVVVVLRWGSAPRHSLPRRSAQETPAQTMDDSGQDYGVKYFSYAHVTPDRAGRPVIDHVARLWYGPNRPIS